MQINFKFLVIPLSFIILCGNSSLYSMEYYDNAMLSFQNKESLNNTQITFIKHISNKVYNVIDNMNNYYKKMKLSNSSNKINGIKDKYFDEFVSKYFKPLTYKQGWYTVSNGSFEFDEKQQLKYLDNWHIGPKDIFEAQLVYKLRFDDKTFIKRITECYEKKLINKEHYISLLSYLLYCNTYHIVDYLNNKILHNSHSFVNNQDILTEVTANFATQLIETFESDIIAQFYKNRSITDFVNSCIDNVAYIGADKDNYASYKAIMKSIIDKLIPLLMPNNAEVFNMEKKLAIVVEQIIEPIKLGIYCHAFQLIYKQDNNSLKCTLCEKGLRNVNSPTNCYKTILSSPQTIAQIDKEFNITQAIDKYQKSIMK